MSSAPASALLSIVAAPALPAETAAPATPLDPTQTSAFSRMLEAEASLAQAVATVPTEAAAPESTPQLAAEPNADAANDVALALAQAAHAGLSPIPVAEEAPDFSELPTTDLEADAEVDTPSETSEEPTNVTAQSGPRAPQVSRDLPTARTSQEDAAPVAKAAPDENAHVHATMLDADTEIVSEVETSTPIRDAKVSPEFNAAVRLTTKASAPEETESLLVDAQSTDVQTLESTPAKTVTSTQKSDESDTNTSQQTSDVSASAASQLQQAQAFNAAPRALAAPVRTQASQNVEATSNRARVSDHEGNDTELVANETETSSTDTAAIPIEMFLGAAGVLHASASRQISSEAVESDESTETQLGKEETVDADFSFDSSARFTRTVSTFNDDTAPENDFAADVDDVAVSVPAANRQVASDAEAEQAPAFVADLGEVRVIASQNTSRKDIQSVAAEDTKQKEIEIQPLRTELRAAASDRKSVAQVPANDRSAAFSPAFASGEKIARQSSPEGFSFEAAQKEISASTVTASFVDGGRPETIASRNSSEPAATANSSRAQRLLDHTLDAIPNPLRVTTFEIKPEGHGTIRVRISARGEGEKAVWRVQIQTSDPAARSLLSEHLNELRERLPAENVQVELRGANDVRTEVSQRENGGSRERNGEQRQSRGEEQQRQPKQQKSGTFLEWLAAQE